MGSIYFKRGELHLAIADMAYVIADVAAAKVDAHTLHQTFDICQGNNLERIDNLLTLAFTEVSQALSPITLPIPESRWWSAENPPHFEPSGESHMARG